FSIPPITLGTILTSRRPAAIHCFTTCSRAQLRDVVHTQTSAPVTRWRQRPVLRTLAVLREKAPRFRSARGPRRHWIPASILTRASPTSGGFNSYEIFPAGLDDAPRARAACL